MVPQRRMQLAHGAAAGLHARRPAHQRSPISIPKRSGDRMKKMNTETHDRPPFVARDFPGRCKIFPERNVMLLPFQSKWVLDNSRLKLAVKARQIGLSWTTAYRVVRQKLRERARLDAWIASRDEVQAQLFLQDAKRFADILNVAAADLGQTMIDDDGHTAYTLRFANGLRAHSMSSNADAQAGKRGDRILDEFALHPDPRKLYQIAYPGITWGGSLEIFSSHRGSLNYFNELLREITERGNPKGFHSIASHSRTRSTRVFFTNCNRNCRRTIRASTWTKRITSISCGPVQRTKKVSCRSSCASRPMITRRFSGTISLLDANIAKATAGRLIYSTARISSSLVLTWAVSTISP